MDLPPAWIQGDAEPAYARLLTQLHQVVEVLSRCPPGSLLDSLGMEIYRLSAQCAAHADSVFAAVEAGVPEMRPHLVRARLLAVASSEVWQVVRAHGLGPEGVALSTGELRAFDFAFRSLQTSCEPAPGAGGVNSPSSDGPGPLGER